MIDSKEIFANIEKENRMLTYEQNVQYLNDLAYIVVPFDKTYKEFQMLIGNLKMQLANHTGNVKMYELIDAINRLGIDNFNEIIRTKISEGNFSRSPADVSAVLYYLASLHKMFHQKRDA